MEEDIKNMSKEELLEYLEDISQQLDNIALDQIQFAISELQFFKEEYKKLEEENKELIQEKINNSKMIALAQNAILSYEKGYNDGKNLRQSAVQIIVENQQYYMFNKQIERYEKHINKLEEENKKIKNSNDTLKGFVSSIFNDTFEKDFIPTSVIQDKIKELENKKDIIDNQTYSFEEVMEAIIAGLKELLEEGRR